MTFKSLPAFICVAAIFFLSNSTIASEIQGRVMSVSSADNFIMFSTEGKQVPVQLYGIAAQERNQKHSDQALNFLTYLIVQQNLTVKVYLTDTFGRIVGVVSQGEKRTLVNRGTDPIQGMA